MYRLPGPDVNGRTVLIRRRVLPCSSRLDAPYPLEGSARPFFEGLGSEEKDHYVSAGAHFVPWPELAEQTLDWLDRYLGPVH